MHRRAEWDVAQHQRITDLDIAALTRGHGIPNLETARVDDVALLTIGVGQ